MSREVRKKAVFGIEKQGMAKKTTFLIKKCNLLSKSVIFCKQKKRLRQAASRGKSCFSKETLFLAQKKKAPAASRQPRKILKNTQIVTKRSNSGRYGLRIGSK